MTHQKRLAARKAALLKTALADKTVPKANGWGGRRRGAGRTNRSKTVNHMARPYVCGRWPLHITMRLAPGRPSLRRKSVLQVFAKAGEAARKFGLHINQFSILGNHVHLVAEATSNRALAQGMKSLTVRLAKHLRRFSFASDATFTTLSGQPLGLFVGRYHLRVLKTPLAVRKVLNYVLLNEAKHKRKACPQAKANDLLSVYSSGFNFEDWSHLRRSINTQHIAVYENFWRPISPLTNWLSPPQSWLGRAGWKFG